MNEYAPTVAWTNDRQVVRIGVRGRTRLNVLSNAATAAATHVLREVAGEDGLRCIVLEGADGGPFIGGADIKEMAALTPDTAREFITKLHGFCAAISDAPVPVIAAVRGYALGGGMEVAMACDIRITAQNAQWGMPEVRVGLPSVIEAALLPRLVGHGRAANLLYRGGIIDSTEAFRIGLVDECVPEDALPAAVHAAVTDILRCGPRALRAQKRLLRAWAEQPLSESIRMSIDEFAATFEADEPREGLSAFLEKRPATYVSPG